MIRPLAVLSGLCLVGAAGTEALSRLALPALAGPAARLGAGEGLGELPFDGALSAGCALALLGCWAWVLLTSLLVSIEVTAVALDGLGGRKPLPRTLGLCPALVRGVLLAALGVGSVTLAVAPASADGPGTGHAVGAVGGPDGVPDRASLTGLAVPDRTVGAVRAAGQGQAPAPVVLVVHHGECLWNLTAGRMPGASDSAISRGWHRLYAANRARVGPNPDLILPGTRLVVPGPNREDP
ncbi:MAG: LysM peptidoglycan-binding domain-containing protein [Nocardioidaceae bacterium]